MPIQRVEMKEITDPAEVAAEEAAAKKRLEARHARERVWALALRVSNKRRAALLAAMASQLPPDMHMDFLEDMMRHLSAEVLRQHEEELRPRRRERATKTGQDGPKRR
jgi:hypothetical protein